MHKSVHKKHNKRTKSENEYVSAMIQDLSLQRLSDREIVDYLHNEKRIEIARSTVTNIRNRVEKKAAKWYLELKASTTKYIAAYKERLDSLFTYQKKLHEIIDSVKTKDEVKIRAIAELHSIEMDIFNLWKQLPNLDVADPNQKQRREQDQVQQDPAIFDITDINGVEEIPEKYRGLWHAWIQCDGCKRYWQGEQLLNYHKKTSPNTQCSNSIPNVMM